MPDSALDARSVYIHVPFCRHRCGYCDFTLVAGRDDLIARYLQAMRLELQRVSGRPQVETLFFGGGTPSHLPEDSFDELMTAIRSTFDIAPGAEVSLEANPVDVTPSKVETWATHGVNRLSLGVQSFTSEHLAILERDHDPDGVIRAVDAARESIENVSLDLIFAVPQQTESDWSRTLDSALQLQPTHISTYGLTWEPGTAFWNRLEKGELTSAPDTVERSMYEHAIERLVNSGFEHYEISNFALPGFRCRHNLTYWRCLPWYAFGPGAASYLDQCRRVNSRSVLGWLSGWESGHPKLAESEQLSDDEAARERLVFGLRMLDGVHLADIPDSSREDVEKLIEEQLLGHAHDRIRLTREGLFLADEVAVRLI